MTGQSGWLQVDSVTFSVVPEGHGRLVSVDVVEVEDDEHDVGSQREPAVFEGDLLVASVVALCAGVEDLDGSLATQATFEATQKRMLFTDTDAERERIAQPEKSQGSGGFFLCHLGSTEPQLVDGHLDPVAVVEVSAGVRGVFDAEAGTGGVLAHVDTGEGTGLFDQSVGPHVTALERFAVEDAPAGWAESLGAGVGDLEAGFGHDQPE